jgi:hypothetical protein
MIQEENNTRMKVRYCHINNDMTMGSCERNVPRHPEEQVGNGARSSMLKTWSNDMNGRCMM